MSEINLTEYLVFDKPIPYRDICTLYPVKAKDIIDFNLCIDSIIMRKNSLFPIKKILKMSYLDFLKFSSGNLELAKEHNLPVLPAYYFMATSLIQMACVDQKIEYEVIEDNKIGDFFINGKLIDSRAFDDIRRIILLQNGIDFDIDEFINYETELALRESAEYEAKKYNEHMTLEDMVDSLVVGLKLDCPRIKELSIRKFKRYIDRLNKYDNYKILKTAENSGFVSFKNPVSHWMCSIDKNTDKYEDLKTTVEQLKKKI